MCPFVGTGDNPFGLVAKRADFWQVFDSIAASVSCYLLLSLKHGKPLP